MKKRLFIYITLILSAGLSACSAIFIYAAYTSNFNFAKDTVMETARLCAGLYTEDTDFSSFAKAGNDTRITIISPDGTVIKDSRPLDLSTLENHLERPEIQAALNGAPAAHVRYSGTLGTDLIYYALKINQGGSYVFIRTAIPVEKISTYLLQSFPLLLLLLLAIALSCFFLARKMIGRITKPFDAVEGRLRSLTGGKYSTEAIPGSYEEINKITKGIDEIADMLQDSFHALRDEKAKLNYILNNIGDGLFVIDETKNIVLINFAALDIFNARPGVTDKNLNYLSYDKTIASAVDDCINHGKNALFETALNGHIYCTAVKPLPESRLTMAVLSDVTENRRNAERREEFFANASHELKTPLTAIKGFNELTAIHNKDENISRYIDSITRETDRMLSLISDMLKLSELENTEETVPVPVSLAKTVNEIQEALSTVLNEKAIQFEISGDAAVTAEPGHIYDLVKNLVENAVRYNHPDGSVSVKIEKNKKNVRLIVSDNGIGISSEEQTRIFERFYRVEKSRSQQNGGTGLGLSIVKHICVLYDWNLSLKSRLGAGTEVTVTFEV